MIKELLNNEEVVKRLERFAKELDVIKSSLTYKIFGKNLWNSEEIEALQYRVDLYARQCDYTALSYYSDNDIFHADISDRTGVVNLNTYPSKYSTVIDIQCVRHILVKLAGEFSHAHKGAPYHQNIEGMAV